MLKNNQSTNSTLNNTCPAKKPQINKTNGTTLNGQTNGITNGHTNETNGHAKVTTNGDKPPIQNGTNVKIDASKSQKKFTQV